MQQQVVALVCKNFNVSKDLWNRSSNFYNGNTVYVPYIYYFMTNFVNIQQQLDESRF